MHDESTVITQTAAPLPTVAERREVFASRVKLSPTTKLTRAHLAVQSRPALVAQLDAAVAQVATTLGAQLKTEVRCAATLRPATLHPFSHLAGRALFVMLELGGESIGVVEIDALGVGAVLSAIIGSNEPVGLPSKLSNIEDAALSWVVLSTLSELRKQPAFAAFSPRLV